MQTITPFLWFDGNAEEAMSFYVSTFKNSDVQSIRRDGEAGPGPVPKETSWRRASSLKTIDIQRKRAYEGESER